MVDWVKIVTNAAITGAITFFSLYATGTINNTASLISAGVAAIIAALIEIQKNTKPEPVAGKTSSRATFV